MKNKILTLLTLTMLTGSLLVGCGGTETETDNGAGVNTEANVNSEVDTNANEDVATKADVINPDIEYIENEFYGVIADDKLWDNTFVDGENLSNADWTSDNQVVVLTENIPLYAYTKAMAGYIKEGINCRVWIGEDTEWCYVQYVSDEVVSHPGDYARTEDVFAAIRVVEEEQKNMSENAVAYFNRLRDRIVAENENRDSMAKENNVTIQQLEEVDSPEGLKCVGKTLGYFDSDEDIENIMTYIYCNNCNKYYIEYLDETDDYVTFNFYAAE